MSGKRSGWQRPPGASASGWTGQTGADPAVGLMALVDRVDRAHRAALFEMGQTLEGEAKLELNKQGSGRIYRRGGKVHRGLPAVGRNAKNQFVNALGKRAKGRFHQASAKGEPPAPDQGVLRASVGTEQDDLRGSVRVGTGLDYGRILELMLDRPWLSTALERSRRKMTQIITSGLRSAAQPKV